MMTADGYHYTVPVVIRQPDSFKTETLSPHWALIEQMNFVFRETQTKQQLIDIFLHHSE